MADFYAKAWWTDGREPNMPRGWYYSTADTLIPKPLPSPLVEPLGEHAGTPKVRRALQQHLRRVIPLHQLTIYRHDCTQEVLGAIQDARGGVDLVEGELPPKEEYLLYLRYMRAARPDVLARVRAHRGPLDHVLVAKMQEDAQRARVSVQDIRREFMGRVKANKPRKTPPGTDPVWA